jgi:hypothetical protein
MRPRTAKAAVYAAPNAPFAIKRHPLCSVRGREVLVKVPTCCSGAGAAC